MRPTSTGLDLPDAFIERLRLILSPDVFKKTLLEFSQARIVVIRANTLKADANLVREGLAKAGFSLKPVEWYSGAFFVLGSSSRDITETDLYKEGKIYIQNSSSLLPALLLGPLPGEVICDMCAAPGSKTTQIACLMQNKGSILAVDNSKPRFYRLKANLISQGATIVRPLLCDGEAMGRKYPGKFDRILLDGPCSSEGRFSLLESKTFQYWSPKKIKDMVRKQRRLLISAYKALKPGGVLVYSTCTFAPEENEGSLSWLINKVEEAILPEIINLPVKNVMSGLSEWKGKSFHPAVTRAVRILPTDTMEGFFLCKLRKDINKRGQVCEHKS